MKKKSFYLVIGILLGINFQNFAQCNADFKESQDPTCVNSPVYFINISEYPSGTTFSWDFGAGATPATSTALNPPPVVYSTPGQKNVELIISNGGSCWDNKQRQLDVAPEPSVTFTSTAPVCPEVGVDFAYTGDLVLEYMWTFGEGATPSSSVLQNPTGIIYSSPGTKNVTLTVSNGFCSITTTQTIDIYSLPIAFAGEDTTICADRSVQLGTDPTANYSYSWFPPSVLDLPYSSNPVASPVASLTNFILSVTDATTGCQATDTILVTMLTPLISDAGNDVEICFGEEVQIGAALVEGQLYSWSPVAGLDDELIPNPISSADTTTLYTLTVTDGICDPVFDDVLVTVHPLPDANAGVNDTITTGSEIQLIATGGVQYIWTPSFSLSNSAVFNPIASPDETTVYTVSVTDIYGCVKTDDIEITVIEPSYWFPNAFTPDGNGINDVFYIRGEGITDFELYIFNRAGQLVYYSENFYEGWNGKKQGSNEEMPEGAYMFKIKGVDTNDTPIDDSGVINLIR
ncbi:MAG: gliding motility-associated C-terminal domain-containing protein [Bacteroidales bacterium]|nr:gliding motility-associated C-terminal domain-containing protein [Bacteroidales bacterium]